MAAVSATAPPYGADASGARDASASLQRACDAVEGQGGGVVYLPPGIYRLAGPVRAGYGVTLCGDPAGGTELAVHFGAGSEDGPSAVLLPLHRETALRHVTITYPDQSVERPVPYPFAISGGMCRIEDVVLLNAYNGILMEAMNGAFLHRIRGTVLRRGIRAPRSLEFSWMRDIRFAPEFLENRASAAGAALSPGERDALRAFIGAHLVGLELGRLDGLAIDGFSAEGAAVPVRIRKPPEAETHRVFGFGGVVADFPPLRDEYGWDPWYYRMHYADLDAVPPPAPPGVPEAGYRLPGRTDPGSVLNITAEPYAAAGDGRADDTPAFERALAAAGEAGGGTVYLPPGRYRLTRPVRIPAGVELRGPLGVGKIRLHRETCVIEAAFGADAPEPETAPALLTLGPGAGVRGLAIAYPDQPYDVAGFRPYPFAIRGAGSDVRITDCLILNAAYGIDLARERCDNHLVAGVWATCLLEGIRVGAGSRNGHLERLAFSYGPWLEAGRFAGTRTDEGKERLAEFSRSRSIAYRFGHCEGQTGWGLVGFYPRVHFLFARDPGGICRDAVFRLSMHDVADRTGLDLRAGANITLAGYFITGGRDRTHNWLEVDPGFEGPVRVLAKTVEPSFLNHPYDFGDDRVVLAEERSLTAGKPAVASAFLPGNGPERAVDGLWRTAWEAPAGSLLAVDLGAEYTLRRFGIESAGLVSAGRARNTRAAELWAGTDPTDLRRVAGLQTEGFAWASAPVESDTPVRARFVRLVVTDPGEDGVIRVQTFDVFGESDGGGAPR